MGAIIILLLLLGVAIAIGMWVIRVFNQIIIADKRCKNALGQIQTELANRFDMIKKAAQVANASMVKETKGYIDVAQARSGNSLEDLKANQKAQDQAMVKLNALHEAYPDNKSYVQFEKLMGEIKEVENKLKLSRQIYNDCVYKLDLLLTTIPTMFIAPITGVKAREMFQAEEEQQQDANLNDIFGTDAVSGNKSVQTEVETTEDQTGIETTEGQI